MVVEELQILIGCDASTAEKILTELENRLEAFEKRVNSAMPDTGKVRTNASREALKIEKQREQIADSVKQAVNATASAYKKAQAAAQRFGNVLKGVAISADKGNSQVEQSLAERLGALRRASEAADGIKIDPKEVGTTIHTKDAVTFLKNMTAADKYALTLENLLRKLDRLLVKEEELTELGARGDVLGKVRGQIDSTLTQIDKLLLKIEKPAAYDKMATNAKKAAKKTEGVFARLGKNIKRIFSQMVIWRAINGIITSIRQGFENMAQSSDKANATLSDLQSSFTFAKNAIASAFMPALQAIAPLLNRVAIAFANFANSIGALFAKLRGDSTFTKAVYVQQDFAASLSGSNKAAKELQGTLAGFDQINLIQQQDNSGGAAANAVGGMFEEAEVESNIGKFGQKIFDFFEKVKSKIPQPIIDRFTESIEKLKTAWGNLKDNPVWDKLLNIVAGIVALGASVALSALTRGIEALGAAIQFLDSMLKGDWQGMNEALGTIISAPFNLISDLILAIAAAAGASEEEVKRLDEHLRAPTEKQILLQSDTSGFDVGLFKILKDWNANLGAENEKEQMIMTAQFKIGGEDGETIEEGWRRFKESCEKGWEDVVTWWQSSALSKWWSEDVAPWFAKEKWVEAVNGIKEGITEKWAEVQQWWQNNAISKWWAEDVAPWFAKEKWTTAMTGIKQSWEEIWKGAVNAAIEKINRFVDWVNDKMNIKWEPFKIGGKVIFEGGNIQLFRLNRLPTLADGGIAYGDTLARIGEYANARTNPEVIAPLDKLQSMLGNQKDTQIIISLLRRIAEQDNEIALYPSAKLGRIASQSIKMYNATVGAV